ncbi:hypothetical protein M9458_004681, partial [Cirrhinus mrigala]
ITYKESPDSYGPGLLRAGPSGAEWGPPHSMVPISLPTLPVFQGAAVSSEPTPHGAGELATPAGFLPASSHKSRGCRLFGSVEATAKCICMGPAHCRARLSHLIRRSAATFQWDLPHCGEPRAGKEAIEVVPPHDRESGFYSRYFIVPKKDEGLRPFLDLRQLNRSVMWLKFRMLTVSQVVSQIRSEDWFVTIDLKDAYFLVSILPQHRKFLRFAFRGEAYQYRVLPFGLALSPRTFTNCVDAALAPLRLRGIRILNYIADWLILAQSEHIAAPHFEM